MSVTSETGEERVFREAIAAVAASMASEDSSGRGSRRSIFRRRTKKVFNIFITQDVDV